MTVCSISNEATMTLADDPSPAWDAFRRWLVRGLAVLMLASVAIGCATPPSDPEERAVYEETNDPLEPMNRANPAPI